MKYLNIYSYEDFGSVLCSADCLDVPCAVEMVEKRLLLFSFKSLPVPQYRSLRYQPSSSTFNTSMPTVYGKCHVSSYRSVSGTAATIY